MGELSWQHLLILAVVVLVLFGAKRLPDSARALGRSMRIFKAETQGLRDGDRLAEPQAQAPAQAPAQVSAPQFAPTPPAAVRAEETPAPVAEAQRGNQPG